MIPEMSALEQIASRVLEFVPRDIASGQSPACLYGMGLIGQWALPTLKKSGVIVAHCYDADPALNGTYLHGVPIHSASNLASDKPDFVIVTSRHAVGPISTMLATLGIAHVSYDAWYAALEFASFRNTHDTVLNDERSKKVLRAVLMAMLTGDARYCEAVLERDQYFCLPQFFGLQNEIYVDAGAFVGDSVERFIWAQNGIFSKIYAFEPGADQFLALQTRAGRLKAEWALSADTIELVHAALGEDDRKSFAGKRGVLTSLAVRETQTPGSRAINILNLDRYLNGARITFLKADVEGMEMALLKGARATIERYKPKIAICAYHYPADVPALSSYLREIVPDYNFSLRHHSPRLLETVLYCWAD
jgi:FkbM family methyltransferase